MSNAIETIAKLFENNISTDNAALIAIFAFIASLFSAFLSFTASRRTSYLNAVTSERSKWINALRENISKFSGHLRTLSVLNAEQTAGQRSEIVADVNKLISLVLLQLNPAGLIEKNIANLLEKMPNIADKKDAEKLSTMDDFLIEHCRWLLKEEWEKVKYESSGFIGRTWLSFKSWKFRYQYRQFCKEKGAIPAL